MSRIPYKWLVATAFVLGLFLEILDMTVLNTALPILGEHFRADTAQLQWLITAYLVSLAGFIPASGWVADRFGDKRTFLFALAVYTGANLWAGTAGSINELIAARVTQGIGGGLLTPVGTAMLFRAFPPNERARASAMLAIPTTLAPMLGPVLGGWLADNISWRWVFFLKVPIGVIGLVFSALVLKPGERTATGRFDVLGFLTGGGGLATLLVGLERGAREGWSDTTTLVLVGIGVALGAVFIVTESRVASPMLDLRLLRDRMFALGNVLMLPAAGASMGAMFVIPILVQTQRGLSATESGLLTAFQAIGMLAVLPFTNRLFMRFGPRRLLIGGFTVIAASQFAMMALGPSTSLNLIRGSMLLMGFAGGLVMVPLQAATFSQISFAATARASALFSTARQVAASVGVAMIATTLTVRTSQRLGALDQGATSAATTAAQFGAYHDVFLVSGLIGLFGVALALLIRDADAAASRAPAATTADTPTTLTATTRSPLPMRANASDTVATEGMS